MERIGRIITVKHHLAAPKVRLRATEISRRTSSSATPEVSRHRMRELCQVVDGTPVAPANDTALTRS